MNEKRYVVGFLAIIIIFGTSQEFQVKIL